MKLTFLGATGTVTGSKYLVEEEGKRVLVDCGLFQGLKELRLRNWGEFPVDPKTLDAVILTHAHLDHTGYLPVLVKKGYGGPIYCTPATFDLCKILLPDSGRLQEEEAEYANRKHFSKHRPALPLYTQEDAEHSLKQFNTIGLNEEFSVNQHFKFRFTRAGHILGAAFVTCQGKNSRLVFSGDLGRPGDLVLRPPEMIHQADYLVVESTYGGRRHPQVDLLDELAKVINRTMERRGVLVIPAFSVGRSQTLLYCMHELKSKKAIPDVPVYLNSPMSLSATRIFCEHLGEHRLTADQCLGVCEVAKYIHTKEESKALNEKTGPMIILSASGMMTGGRVLHHLKAFAPGERNTILLTGFQAAGTRGANLLSGKQELKIHGGMVPIRAEVVSIDALSAHADEDEILDWLSKFKAAPKTTFITHGEPASASALQHAITSKLSWNTRIPEYKEVVELG